MAREKLVLTYEDYRRMPEARVRNELFGGDLSVTPAPTPYHQRIVRRLASVLGAHADEHGVGEVLTAPIDVVLSPTDVVQPDIVVIRTDRLAIVGAEAIQGVPDLIIEVLSPATAARDRGRKKDTYERFGVADYWILDPENRTLEMYHLEGRAYRMAARVDQDTLHATLFPGLAVDLNSLWKAHA
jgi:Uma2 family endonuclease